MRAARSPKPRRKKKSAPVVRVRLDVDERRAQLLELGLSIFGERNYEETSIDDIAAVAGISKGLLYHYFGSKRGFYVATVRHAAASLVAHVVPDARLAPTERLTSGLHAYLAFVDARAFAYVALMRSGSGVDSEILDILESTRRAIVARILQEGLGILEPRPVFRLALRSWIGAVEAAALEWLERRDMTQEALVTLLSEVLIQTVTIAARLDPDALVFRSEKR